MRLSWPCRRSLDPVMRTFDETGRGIARWHSLEAVWQPALQAEGKLTLKHVFAPLPPLSLCGYSGCIHGPLSSRDEDIFGEFILVQKHAAHVFALG